MEDPKRLAYSLVLKADLDDLFLRIKTASKSERPALIAEAIRLSDASLAHAEARFGPFNREG